MDAQAIVTVSAAVVACTQLLKWALIPDRYGPVAVLALSFVGMAFYVWSQDTFLKSELFTYFSAWVAVATSAAGVYGFTRASAGALTQMLPPPGGGAGSSRTTE